MIIPEQRKVQYCSQPKKRIEKNEEGFLEIIISGIGNFTPTGVAFRPMGSGAWGGFDPLVLDSVDKAKISYWCAEIQVWFCLCQPR